jgi:hypothetical protein
MGWGDEVIPYKDARLSMRLSSESLDLLRRAARCREQDVTSFVLGFALERATNVVDRQARLERMLADAALGISPPPGDEDDDLFLERLEAEGRAGMARRTSARLAAAAQEAGGSAGQV